MVAAVVGSLFSIGLRWLVPLRPIAFAPGYYDSGLFERAAVALANHGWLGAFDTLTLAKGPAYPLFIAATHQFGIPLQVGTQLLYLAGSASFALCVQLVVHRPVATTFADLVLALDPLNYGAEAAAVMRDNIYAGLSLLFLSSLFACVWCALRRIGLLWVLLLAALTGISGAALWLCREEGSWIIPAALLIVIALPPGRFRHTNAIAGPGAGQQDRGPKARAGAGRGGPDRRCPRRNGRLQERARLRRQPHE